MSVWYCEKCQYRGDPKYIYWGNPVTSFLLWFIGVIFFSPLFLAIAFTYSIFRGNATAAVCPKCGAEEAIPYESSDPG